MESMEISVSDKELDNPKEDSPIGPQKPDAIEEMILASVDEPYNGDGSISGDASDMSLLGDIYSESGDFGIDPGSDQGDDMSEAGEDHEFEIIDELESEEEKDEEGGSVENGKDRDSRGVTSDSDLDDTELHAMLEKDVTKDSIREKGDPDAPEIKLKVILKELETDPFDLLPPGWIVLNHSCGMPIYLHKDSRVVTMAKPYSLGSASTRGHDIPISAIPCMQYKKQLGKLGINKSVPEEKEGNKDSEEKNDDTADKNNFDEEKDTTEVNSSEEKPDIKTLKDSVLVAGEVSKCPFSSPNKVWCVSEETSKEVSSTSIEQATDPVINGLELKNPDTSKTVWVSSNGNFKRLSINCDNGVKEVCDNTSDQSLTQTKTVDLKSSAEENIAVSLDSSTSVDKVGTGKVTNGNDDSDLEEGEIDEGEDEDDDVLKEPSVHSKRYRNKMKKENAIKSQSISEVTTSLSSSLPGNTSFQDVCTDTPEVTNSSTEVKVPQEEVTGNEEPSEMVTSSTNTLAAIKRKLEDLKNRQVTNSKQRKLEERRRNLSPGGAGVGNLSRYFLQADVNLSVDSSMHPIQNTDPSQEDSLSLLKSQSAETKVKTAEERAKELIVNAEDVHTYCQRLFHFKTIEVKRYGSWRDRREHLKKLARRKRPELPSSTKLLTCPVMEDDQKDGNKKKREFVLNPTGKSYLCILHEYMQRTMKAKPVYTFQELVNSKMPYGATVSINNVSYGTGYASSKKVAKQEAAKETLKIIIPDLFKKMTDQEITRRGCGNDSDLTFFDEIEVTDPRVNELGIKVGQPGPYQILLECLKRNFGMGNTDCKITTQSLKNQKCEFTITVGKHTATVLARNKKDGKHFASQAILAKLHPHVHSWGSLLRLYATNIEKPVEKVEQMNEIKSLTANKKVLESLREEMKKLHQQKEAIQSKGTITISSKDLPSKMTKLDL